MLDDVCQGQTNQSIAGISARAIQFVRIVEGVAALGGAALFVNLLKAFAVAGNGGIKAGVESRFDIEQGSERASWSTVLFLWAILEVHDVD